MNKYPHQRLTWNYHLSPEFQVRLEHLKTWLSTYKYLDYPSYSARKLTTDFLYKIYYGGQFVSEHNEQSETE